MRKIYLVVAGFVCSTALFAGGIVTNTNQSASFIRMPSRNGSTGIDAVYYNPAGLVKLNDGFHVSLNNQTIFQEKTVTSNFSSLNNNTYIGDVTVPSFPTLFAVYKKNKLALSLGIGPNGGGGTAEYASGLPSFEMPISLIPSSLTASGIPTTEYSADISFDGSSIFWGAQVGGSYAINEMFSVSAGVRMIYAKNTYKGAIKNIMINPTYAAVGATGTMMSAPTFFTNLSTYLTGVSASAYGAATGMQGLIDYNVGSLTFAQAQAAGAITSAQRAQLEGGLLAMGSTQAQIDAMTITTAQATYNAYGAGFAASANTATTNAAKTADMNVDASQTGFGFTPFVGVNFNLDNKLNVGVKFEMNTRLELTNKADADKDANGKFKNDSTFRNDIPAILAVGVEYKILDELRVSASWTHFFDKNADWNGKEKFIDNNFYEFGLGLEYDVSKLITLSAGYLHGQTGVGQGYQTDMSFSNTSNSVGFGGRLNVNQKLSIDLGALYTMYTVGSENKTYAISETTSIPYKETYDKSNINFSIGVNYSF